MSRKVKPQCFEGDKVVILRCQRPAARQNSKSRCVNTADSKTTFFLDVGAWQCDSSGRAHTPFALVSGHDVVLCSWLKNHPDEKSGKLFTDLTYVGPKSKIAAFKPAPLVEQFLLHAASKKLHSRVLPPTFDRLVVVGQHGFVLKWCRVPRRLTSDEQLLVFVGDLHLQLMTGYPIDFFRYKVPGQSEMRSLDLELRMLLELTRALKRETGKDVKSVQLGDMYEVWESEIVLRHLYFLFLHLSRRYTLGIKPMPSRVLMTSGSPLFDIPREIVNKVIESGKVPSIPDFHQLVAADNARKQGTVVMGSMNPDRIDRDGVDFKSTDGICDAIRKAHPYLFGKLYGNDRGIRTGLFDIETRGNHDNYMMNSYWRDVMKNWDRIDPQLRKYDKHNWFRSPTKSANGKHSFSFNFGEAKRIWIEHGHIYDWHNNNRDWWTHSHGFDVVYAYLYSHLLHKLDASKWTPQTLKAKIVRSLADVVVDVQNFEMRLFQLERAKVLQRGSDTADGVSSGTLALIVMGHTHKPYLSTLENLWQEKKIEYEKYYGGKYHLATSRIMERFPK